MKISKKPTLAVVLDTRKVKKNGESPIRLRVTYTRFQKYYNVGENATPDVYVKILETGNPRTKPKKGIKEKQQWENWNNLRIGFEAIETRAKEIIDSINQFNFEDFENLMFGTSTGKHDLISVYIQRIDNFKKHKQIGTAEWYNNSLNSFRNYWKFINKKAEVIPFEKIIPDILKGYQRYMTDTLNRSKTTVGMYLRAMRAVFNYAIQKGYTSHYPFGRGKYTVPGQKRVKKALTLAQIQYLANIDNLTPEQTKARDFFILSYLMQGINLIDLAFMKNKDIQGEIFEYYRQKVRNTSGENETKIVIPLEDEIKRIIEKYKNHSINPDSLLFDIIDKSDNAIDSKRKIKNFIRFINQHLKPICTANGIPTEISYQWARHSFATHLIQQNANIKLISQALGHQNLKTTQGYIDSFPNEVISDYKKIMIENISKVKAQIS